MRGNCNLDQGILSSPEERELHSSASIGIRTLTVIRGALPRRALAMILEWAALHREELLQDWDLCATKQTPRKIPPLV